MPVWVSELPCTSSVSSWNEVLPCAKSQLKAQENESTLSRNKNSAHALTPTYRAMTRAMWKTPDKPKRRKHKTKAEPNLNYQVIELWTNKNDYYLKWLSFEMVYYAIPLPKIMYYCTISYIIYLSPEVRGSMIHIYITTSFNCALLCSFQ